METLIQAAAEIGLFAAKAVLVVFCVGLIVSLVAAFAMKAKHQTEGLTVESLNKQIAKFSKTIYRQVLDKQQLKQRKKQEKKTSPPGKSKQGRVFVLDFEGDIKARRVEQLRDEITALLSVSEPGDEVVLRLESPGGMVSPYGLATSQLLRIKERKLKLTVCVDKVAASGGYMMACTGDKILAAPFAIVGSIGVAAVVPNIHKWLKKHDIDCDEVTAGEYKRTVSLLGKPTGKGHQRFQQQLHDMHDLFKEFVLSQRPVLDVAQVGTGEYWYGRRALDLKLVDELKTSDEYLFDLHKSKQIYVLHIKPKKTWHEKLTEAASLSLSKAGEKFLNHPNTGP